MSPTPSGLFRLQAGAWGALGILCAGLLGHAILFDEEVPFVRAAGGPAWIMAALPQTADLIAVDPAAPPVHVFHKRFQAKAEGGEAHLRGRALRHALVHLNGEPVPLVARGNGWKQGFEADLRGRLREGTNSLRVSVSNPAGPPLVQLEVDAPGGRVVTDSSWQVTPGPGAPSYAEIATDVALHPESRQLPTPLEGAPRQAALLFVIFAGTAGLAWRRPGWTRRIRDAHWPLLTLAAMTLFWLALFGLKFWRIPLGVGFDAPGHLAYIDFLLEFRALPTAAYGFSTYHPPLFYGMTAGLIELFGVTADTGVGRVVYHAIPFASGLANVWLTAWVARQLWPQEGLRPSLAIATAGLLPMNLYMSAYVSNEPLLAAWVSAALALGTSALLAQRVRLRVLASLAGVLGAALLTKFTALAVAPGIAFFVALRGVWGEEGGGPGRALARFGGLMLGAGAIAAWFYWRNWTLFGDPLVWNLDVPGAATWWMRPGFHTSAWYLDFGESLSHPLFAGYASFWDGVYSTLWGDGLVAGMARASTRHEFWNHPFQGLTYLLALPVTGVMAAGAIRLWQRSLVDPSLGRRLVLSMHTAVLFGLAFSLLLISLRLPFYAQAKAFYLLCAVLPLALASAEGLGGAARWLGRSSGPWPRALRCMGLGWLTSLAACIVLAHLG